jgi:DNA-binding MarR family transcriptional regulator
MADRLDLSERGVQLILRDLRRAGYIKGHHDHSDKRRINYTVVPTKPLRRKSLQNHTVGELLQLLTEAEASNRPMQDRPS